MTTPRLGWIAISVVVFVPVAVIFAAALKGYPGDRSIYAAFSLFFFILLCSAFYRASTYFYGFIVVFLWLGLWLKISLHQIFDYPFTEAVGRFAAKPENWDAVLVVAMAGSIGVLVARLVYEALRFRTTLVAIPSAPKWYTQAPGLIWTFVLAAMSLFAVLNVALGIQQSGLVPRTILPWPTNAVVYWMLNSGFAFSVLTLAWWRLGSKGLAIRSGYAAIVEASISTISLLSRGQYVFHAFPALLSLTLNRRAAKDAKVFSAVGLVAAACIMLVLSLSTVNTLRAYYYSGVPLGAPTFDVSTVSNKVGAQLLFTVDRWIGAEGIMAVSSYPQKNFSTFLRALTERSEIGSTTFYQEVSNSQYQRIDRTKYSFATLPGAVAFLFFSGSMAFVVIGMAMLTIIAMLSERLVFVLSGNPLLCSFWGCTVANVIAQLGEAPRVLIPFFIMCALGVLFVSCLQTTLVSSIIQRIGGALRLTRSATH